MGVTEEVWEEWKRKRRQKIRAEKGSPEARRNTAAKQIEPNNLEETAKDHEDKKDRRTRRKEDTADGRNPASLEEDVEDTDDADDLDFYMSCWLPA